MPAMAASAPEIYSQYQKMIIYLRLVALMALDNNAVLELIQKNYLDSFDAGLDLNERMTGKMYSIPDLVWPEYAEQLAYALKQNIQKIGQKSLIISGETEPKTPTIQSWLSDYDRSLGPDLRSNIQQEEYLAKNPNAKLLSENEKAKLRNVLRFYNNLKPIPAAVIDKALKDAGIYDELTEESAGEISVSSQYQITEPTIIQAPKRYVRPDGRDQYLEPVAEEKAMPKPAPFIPPTTKISPEPSQQPAYTRPAQIPPRPPQPARPIQQTIPPVARPATPLFSSPPQTAQQPPQPPHKTAPHFFQPPVSAPATQSQPTSSPLPPLSQPATPQFPPAPSRPPQFQPQQPPIAPFGPRPTFDRPPSQALPEQNPYLEPIDVPELPKTPSPPKPEPDSRIQGNIVDLKNFPRE
jgi:hypothetical protein